MTASLTPAHRPLDPRSKDHRALERAGLLPVPVPPPPAHVPLHLVEAEGQVQVHTASYRGSFSSVLSQAVRSAGLGSRVLIVQFLKGGVEQGPAGRVQICGGLTWLRPDVPACVETSDHPGAADAVADVWQFCQQSLLAGDLDHLVLDEVGLAIGLGYLQEQDLIEALQQRPGSMDVIITGPSIPSQVMEMADQVTELRRGF